jgi:hypothetical protein
MTTVIKIDEEDGCGRMQPRPIAFDDSTGHATMVSEADPLPVTIAGGVTIDAGSITASTEYVEDDAAPVNPTGGILLARRRDALVPETSADGDVVALNATGKGELHVADTDALAALASILAKIIAAPATEASVAAAASTLASILTAVQGTLAVSAASLPLPTGAATAARQDTGNTSLASIVTALAGTLAISAASLPLPSGAATGAKQDTGNTSLASIVTALAGTLAISAASLPLPSGAATGAKQDTGNTSLASIASALAAALPLPTGAATAANQSTGNSSLASILSALGGTLAVSGPLTAAQLHADAEYEAVGASASDQPLGATGGIGDYLSHLIITPGTTAAGAVSIKDGSGSSIPIFAGGTGSVPGLAPFTVYVGATSTSGAWKVTTGANVTAVGVGNFT